MRILPVALAAALAGCGGGGAGSSSAPPPSPRPGSSAPVLVSFIQQRPGALIDKITVRTDGSGLFDRPSGGVGRVLREVELTPAALDRLQAGLRDVPSRLGAAHGAPAPNGATYIMRFGGRTVVARQGREPTRLRAPIQLLAGLLIGDNVREVTGEQLGGVAGSTHTSDIGKVRVAPELVFFQRQGAAGATLDTFTVRADGSAQLAKRYGGAGGRFEDLSLEPGELGALRGELARLPHGSSIERGAPPAQGANYLMRYRGRTLTGRAGGITPAARPAVRRLDGFIDGIGVTKPRRETATHAAG